MSIAITVFLLCTIITAGPGARQQEGGMIAHRHDDEQFNKLQAMRVWTIINALDVDMSTDKGVALIGAIKKHTDNRRQLSARGHEILIELHKALGRGDDIEEEEIKRLLEKHDGIQQEILDLMKTEKEEIEGLLNPIERAKLIIAEETFRQRLRSAMRGHGYGSGRPKGGPPREF